MIRFNKRYGMTIDPHNFTLYSFHDNDVMDDDGNPTGEKVEIKTLVGYYGKFDSLYRGLLDHNIRDRGRQAKTVQEIMEHLIDAQKSLDDDIGRELKRLELENIKLKGGK